MGYPKELLNDDEDIVLDRRPHWVYMAGPIACFVGSVLFLFFSIAMREYEFLIYIALLLMLVCGVALLARYLKWITTEFVVTTDRVIFRQGFIAKHGVEIPLERVQNISSRQSVVERILGLGNLQIQSAGESGDQDFSHIAKPFVVQNIIHAERERREASDRAQMGVGAGGQGQISIAEQLEKLADLRSKGLLTPQEFEIEKAKLISGTQGQPGNQYPPQPGFGAPGPGGMYDGV